MYPSYRKKILKEYLHTDVHCSMIHTSQGVETPKCPSKDEWMKKTWPIHIVECSLALKNKDIVSYATAWMNLRAICIVKLTSYIKKTHDSTYIKCSKFTEAEWNGGCQDQREGHMESSLMSPESPLCEM